MKKLFVMTFLFLALLSCSSGTKDKGSGQSSSFIVGIITASTTQEAGMNQIDILKRGKVLNLKTCIKDYVYLSSIKEETFRISGGKEEIDVVTDHNGCLYWSEEVNIDDLTSMGAIMTERVVTGTGTYEGSVTVPLAFKLLSSGGAAVIDDRYRDIPASDAANKQRSEGVSFIMGEINIAPAISIMSEEELRKAMRHVRLSMSVTIMTTEGQGVSNHPFKIALIDGDQSVDDIDWDKISPVESPSRSGQHITSATITYKRFSAEYYMKKYVVVKSLERPFENVIQKREVYLNPWQWWGRFFFWDTLWDSAKPDEVPQYRKAKKRQPQLLVQEIFLSYTGNDENSYNVNRYMDLTFKKNYQIKFRPLLNRKVSFVPGQDIMLYEIIHVAQLKAKLVLIRPKDGVLDLKKLSERGIEGLDDYAYVTGKEVILDVQENLAQANFSFEFDFRQTPFMVTRSLLLAEISPADDDWDVEPVVVTVTMKSGEFWITEGALFATELFNGIGDEGIGIFRDNVPTPPLANGQLVEEGEDPGVPIGRAVHPMAEAGLQAMDERKADTYGSAYDLGQSIGESIPSLKDDDSDDVRYIFISEDVESEESNELTRIPPHLQIKERESKWKYDPLQTFVKMEKQSTEMEDRLFHFPSQEEIVANFKEKYEPALTRMENMDYTTQEEHKQMEREVGMKAFYNLTTNKKVFELFLSDPRGVELAESVARNRWNGPISSLIKKLRGIKPVYIGGERDVQDVYWETVMLLTRMFFHDHMSPKAFHILTSDNPLDYFKITPLTFLNEKPRIISQNGNAAKASNTRKVLAGRDTMPVSLAMVDVYSEKHATAHTISGNFGFSPKALISGGITNFSRMSAVGAGRIGTLVGGYRAGYNRSRSWFKEMGQKKDALLSSQFTLLIDQLLLEFEADTTSCLHIEARDPDGEGYDSLFYMFGTDKDSYLVCYPQKNDKRLFREMWYFINTANTDSTHFVDHNNLANRPIVMPLRGLRNFVQFRNSLVHQVENFIVMRKDQYEPLARHALKDLYNIRIDDIPEFLSDGEFPGAIPWNYGSELRQLNLDGSTKLGVFGKDL